MSVCLQDPAKTPKNGTSVDLKPVYGGGNEMTSSGRKAKQGDMVYCPGIPFPVAGLRVANIVGSCSV